MVICWLFKLTIMVIIKVTSTSTTVIKDAVITYVRCSHSDFNDVWFRSSWYSW